MQFWSVDQERIQIDFFFDNRAALTIEREHDHNPAVSYKLYGNSYLIESI